VPAVVRRFPSERAAGPSHLCCQRPRASTRQLPGDRRWLILAVVAVAQLMVVLDSTIVNIALPSAQHSLGFANSDRQWVVTPARRRSGACC
jgi:hypothetical protein